MALELYFYNECGFSETVLNTMTNLGCEDKITKKNIRENPEYEKELIALCGAKTVPVLVIDGVALRRQSMFALAQPAHDFIHAATTTAALWRMSRHKY